MGEENGRSQIAPTEVYSCIVPHGGLDEGAGAYRMLPYEVGFVHCAFDERTAGASPRPTRGTDRRGRRSLRGAHCASEGRVGGSTREWEHTGCSPTR